jgi:uncharacterized protein (TIGR03067 family)
MYRLALLAVAALVAGGTPDDLKRMQGTWSVGIVEVDGKEPSKDEKNLRLKLAIEGDRYKTYVGEQYLSAGTLKLDAAAKPRALDATYTDGPFKGTVQRGIYEITPEGMTVNFAKPGADRPRTFKAGPGETLLRYTRAKTDEKK